MATTPIWSPDGNVHQIPNDQVDAALSAGGQKAVRLSDPTNTLRWVPESHVKDALAAGARPLDVPATASIQAQPSVGSLPWIKQKYWEGVDAVTRNLPAIGGTVGSVLGGLAGTAAEPGLGTIAGAGAGGAIGGGVGTNARRMARSLAGFEVPPAEQYSKEFVTESAKQGAYGAAGEAGAQVVGRALRVPGAIADLPENARFRRYIYGDNPEKTVNDALVKHADEVTAVKDANTATNLDNQQTAADWYAKQRKIQDQYELDKEAVGQKQAELNRQAASDTLQQQKEYSQQAYIAKQIHDAQVQQVGRAKEIADNLDKNAQAFGDASKALATKVAAQGKDLYSVVNGKINKLADPTVAPDNLVNAVKNANDNLIQGSPESIKQFKSILSHDTADDAVGGMINGMQLNPADIDVTTTGGRQLYELLGGGKTAPFKFTDLQGYYTELGQKMAEGGMLPDVYRAVKSVHTAIGREMQSIAARAGAADDLAAAQKFWTQYKVTFHNMDSLAKGGSPVARVIRAEDPGFMAAPVTGKSSARAVDMLAKYDPALAKQAADIAQAQAELKSLPKNAEPFVMKPAPPPVEPKILPEPTKPVPPEIATAPTPKDLKPLPDAPDLEQEILAKRAADLAKTSGGLNRLNGWDFASVAGSGGALLRGHPMLALASLGVTVLRHGTGVLLEHPGVVEALTRVTPSDLEILGKFSPAQQATIQKGITGALVAGARNGTLKEAPTGIAGFLTSPQYKAVTAAIQAGSRVPEAKADLQKNPLAAPPGKDQTRRYTSVDQVMEDAKNGLITPQDAARLSQQLKGKAGAITRPMPPPQ